MSDALHACSTLYMLSCPNSTIVDTSIYIVAEFGWGIPLCSGIIPLADWLLVVVFPRGLNLSQLGSAGPCQSGFECEDSGTL